MIQHIVKELDDHISIIKEKKRVKTFLDTITEWNYQEDDTSKMKTYYNCFDFIKKYIVSISRVFPQMILNACKHTMFGLTKNPLKRE